MTERLRLNGGSYHERKPGRNQGVERLQDQRSTVITDELNKILTMLTGACPRVRSSVSISTEGYMSMSMCTASKTC